MESDTRMIRPPNGLRQTLINTEKLWISKALTETRGNTNQAASLLKMNRTTLCMRIKHLGLWDWKESIKQPWRSPRLLDVHAEKPSPPKGENP